MTSEKGLMAQSENLPALADLSQEEFEKLPEEQREALMAQSASTGSTFEETLYLQMDRDDGDTFGSMFFRQGEQKKYVEDNELVEVIIATMDQYWRPTKKTAEKDWDDNTVEYSVDIIPSLIGLPDAKPVLYKHTFPFQEFENGTKERRRYTETEKVVELADGNLSKEDKQEFGLSMVKRLHVFVREKGEEFNYEVPIIISCGGFHFKNLINYVNNPDMQNFVVKVTSLITEEKDYNNPNKKRKMPVFDYEITQERLTGTQQFMALSFREKHAHELLNALGSKVTDAKEATDEESQEDLAALEETMGIKAPNPSSKESDSSSS